MIRHENTQAYSISIPETTGSAIVFASPHSGRAYTKDFRNKSILDLLTLRSSEDAYVDHFVDALPSHGAPTICATVPRAFIDLNRAPNELDPALIAGVKSRGLNPRIASGLGIIPRVVANARPIYHGKLALSEAESRIARFWTPYHAALGDLLNQTHQRWGHSILLDLHSMPNEAVSTFGPKNAQPDIILGDRFGASASQSIVRALEIALTREGFKVARNAPFAGAYITQRYGRPHSDQHAIQIEINRSLYLNERTIELSSEFENVKSRLQNAFQSMISQYGANRNLAAE